MLNKQQQNQINRDIRLFAEHHPIKQVKATVSRLLIGYLEAHDDLPDYHKQLLFDVEGLYDLLDAIDNAVPPDPVEGAKKFYHN